MRPAVLGLMSSGLKSSIFYPVVSGDDGYAEGAGEYDFSSSKNHCIMGKNSGPRDDRAWIRFPNVNIPNGAIIDSAIVRFTAHTSELGGVFDTHLSFGAIDDAVAPINAAQLDGASKTSERPWPFGPFVDGDQHDSTDIAPELQEVIDRVGWVSGNAVIFYAMNYGAGSTGAIRVFSAIDWLSGAEKAELHVSWSS